MAKTDKPKTTTKIEESEPEESNPTVAKKGAGVYPLSDGKWHVSITLPSGRVKVLGEHFQSHAEAKKAYTEASSMNYPLPPPPDPSAPHDDLTADSVVVGNPSSKFH